MPSDGCNRTLAAVALLTAFAMAFGCVMMDVSSAETTEQDLGQKWSYTIQFVFTGDNAESIEWDFGDGTTSTEWNPAHTYSEKGIYHVKQTVTNPNGSVETLYKVEVMGFPYVTLVYNNGQDNGTVQQSAYNVTAQRPADPVRDGYDFTGWFADDKCTQEFDWDNTKITEPVTVYAGWQVAGEQDSEEGDNVFLYATIMLLVIAVICVIAAVATGMIYLVVPGVVLALIAVITGLMWGGVI